MYSPPEPSPKISVDLVDRWLSRSCEALLTTWDTKLGDLLARQLERAG